MKFYLPLHFYCNKYHNFTIFAIMRQKFNYILMADIVDSRKANQLKLMQDFKNLAAGTNQDLKDQFLSPITITLGDEFQSIAKDLSAAISILFHLEETIVKTQKKFKLRYVLLEGAIQTPINTQIAYGMLGSGLTKAREILTNSKRQKTRFNINLRDNLLGNALNNSWVVMQKIIDRWKPEKDYYIVGEFLENKDYKKVAEDLEKERSLIWKREKSLAIEEYFAQKNVIRYLASK